MFEKFVINGFVQKCRCGGEIFLSVIIGEDQENFINDLGYIAQCKECLRTGGMENTIREAFDNSQAQDQSEGSTF
jgi:hypothetical protein